MIENPCKKCDDPAMGCANTCGDLAEYRYIEKLEKELKQAKELLEVAVNDMHNSVNDVHCKYCSKWHTDQCQGTSHLDCYIKNKFEWRYANEALALIKDGST